MSVQSSNTQKAFPQKVGLIRGGQLGRMLIQAGLNYDFKVAVLDSDAHCPCRYFCEEFVQGDFLDYQTVYEFGHRVDLLTLEFEHVNLQALEKLESEGRRVYPSAAVLRVVQDKGAQKEFYRREGIPTADFVLIETRDDIRSRTNFLPAVQKLRVSGYDGKGICKINSLNDLNDAFDKPSVLEKRVDFVKEIAVIVARNQNGEIATYPVVEMDFHNQAHVLEFLFAPADVTLDVAKEAQRLAVLVAQKLEVVGLLAVEMFVTRDGRVLVNEIAPRPHNSGHQTIEANVTSQFDQHLRAILNLPLGSTALRSPTVMFNLLGAPGFTGEAKYLGWEEALKQKDVYIHLYGKKKTAPMRKMGHVTVLDDQLSRAKEKAKWLKEVLKIVA